jgi:opacity protein-like surface antigen
MKTLITLAATLAFCLAAAAQAADKPNIVVIWGDDIGISNISAYSEGLMGYQTPNIDRMAKEGMKFTDYYAENSCTAGRAAFIRPECFSHRQQQGWAARSQAGS